MSIKQEWERTDGVFAGLGRLVYGLRFVLWCIRTPKLFGAPFILGPGARIIIRGEGRITRGRGLVIRRNLTATIEGPVSFGRNVFINEGAYIAVQGGLTVGDYTRIGERVSIHDQNHKFEPIGIHHEGYTVHPIEIGKRVWIGANCVLLPGVVIGDDAVLGAGSIVRGTIPPRVLAAGNPAKVIRKLN